LRRIAAPLIGDDEEVVDFCISKIATYKVPRYVRFVRDWPMSGTKVKKFELRDDLLQAAGLQVPAGQDTPFPTWDALYDFARRAVRKGPSPETTATTVSVVLTNPRRPCLSHRALKIK
jgi:hypothetical protein